MTNPPGKRKTLTSGQKVYYEDDKDFTTNTELVLWGGGLCFAYSLSAGTHSTTDGITFTFDGTKITSII